MLIGSAIVTLPVGGAVTDTIQADTFATATRATRFLAVLTGDTREAEALSVLANTLPVTVSGLTEFINGAVRGGSTFYTPTATVTANTVVATFARWVLSIEFAGRALEPWKTLAKPFKAKTVAVTLVGARSFNFAVFTLPAVRASTETFVTFTMLTASAAVGHVKFTGFTLEAIGADTRLCLNVAATII